MNLRRRLLKDIGDQLASDGYLRDPAKLIGRKFRFATGNVLETKKLKEGDTLRMLALDENDKALSDAQPFVLYGTIVGLDYTGDGMLAVRISPHHTALGHIPGIYLNSNGTATIYGGEVRALSPRAGQDFDAQYIIDGEIVGEFKLL